MAKGRLNYNARPQHTNLAMDDTTHIEDRLSCLHAELGIPTGYGRDPVRPKFTEATDLADAGVSFLGLPQRLTPAALAAWLHMVQQAAGDGVRLLLVSGFRSVDYQADLIRRKLASGESIDEVLRVVAAPGFSEHHTGRAIDIAAPGSRPLTEEFEASDAFAWLAKNAESAGFSMSYPRGNAQGFIFEPWHWCYRENAAD